MKKTLNIAYLRCSKDIQDVKHQEKSIAAYCDKNNIKLDETLRDEGISAWSTEISQREALSEILHLAHEGKINNLIVFESSRISRQFMQGQNIIDELTKCNVSVHSVMDGGQINKNELDQLWNSFKFFMNQKSSQETSARIKSAKKLAKEQGLYLGHPVLPGFKIVDGKEIIDEEASPSIDDMFDTYINYGSKATMEKFGIKTHQVLMQKLKNEKYIKIVGESKFNHAQKIISKRRCNEKKSDTRSLNRSDILFEGLLYHKYCGSKLVIYRDRKGNPVFRCKKCKGDPNITAKKSFTGNKLIANLEHEIEEVLDTLNQDKLKEKYDSRCNKNKTVINYQLKELKRHIEQKNKALTLANAKLERYIIEDKSDAMISAVSNMIKEINTELDKLNNQLDQKQTELNNITINEKHQEDLIESIINARDIYKNADTNKKKAVLNLLVRRIEVSDIDDYDIYLNI